VKPSKREVDDNRDYEQFSRLLHAALQDPFIHNRIQELLKMDSYRRRRQLNNWLEQLRLRNAPQKLRHLLAFLFDDEIAEKTISLMEMQGNSNHNVYFKSHKKGYS
jgi:hypothetical protein